MLKLQASSEELYFPQLGKTMCLPTTKCSGRFNEILFVILVRRSKEKSFLEPGETMRQREGKPQRASFCASAPTVAHYRIQCRARVP